LGIARPARDFRDEVADRSKHASSPCAHLDILIRSPSRHRIGYKALLTTLGGENAAVCFA
jgi:hypothetical protein